MTMKQCNNLKIGYLSISILTLLIFLIFPLNAFAESSYVLPYPSAMPGSIFYKPRMVWDQTIKYWYFGDFGQFKYNLRLSDKYLVEAKTLFEYKQYLLGYKSLLSSDEYFKEIKPALISASKNGKNTSLNEKILKEASGKHIEELEKLKAIVPERFEWKPEKANPTKLNLWENINSSVDLRKRVP